MNGIPAYSGSDFLPWGS